VSSWVLDLPGHTQNYQPFPNFEVARRRVRRCSARLCFPLYLAEVHGAIGDVFWGPAFHFQPAVFSIKKTRTGGSSMMPSLLLEPVIVPAQSIGIQVEWSFRPEIQFTGIASTGISRAMNPGADDEALVCSAGWRSPMGSDALEAAQGTVEKAVKSSP